MAVATTGNETLSPDDAVDMLDELLEAQNHSYILGLKLKLPLHKVEAIHSNHRQTENYLLQVLIEFTKQTDPKPTWNVITDALRSPSVNLPYLATKVEAAHIPDATATRDIVPPTGSVSPQQVIKTKTKIREFEKKFNDLKKFTRESLEKSKVAVKDVADALTSLPADDMDEHRQFIESNVRAFYEAVDHSMLFGIMNPYWNYLSYQLLDYLIQEFDLDKVKGEMEAYKKKLKQFREKTTLALFCQTKRRRRWLWLDPSFQKVVAKFDWPDEVTLEIVEQFRQEYAYHYSLRECALLVAEIRPGSFIITWLIPESIVEKAKANVPIAVLKKYSVTELEVAGMSVYKHQVPTEPSSSGTSLKLTLSGILRLRSSVRPTLAGGLVLCVLSLLYCCFQFEPYHFILDFELISMKILHVCVFLIGVSITAECFFSIVSYISRLQFVTIFKQYRIILFRHSSLFILILTAFSVANAVSLFIQVRDHWIRHMVVTIQILQCVPTLLQVIHSLMQGVYLLLSGHGKPPQGDTAAMTKHLQSQMRLNIIFLFYSLTIGVTIAYNSYSIKTRAIVVYMLGEILYRVCSFYLLRDVKAQYKEDDCFPPASLERRHDTGKNPSRLLLIDTFSRWVFR